MVKTLASREVTFCETAWLMASISLVRRLINSPAGLRSKNEIGQRLQMGEEGPCAFVSAPAGRCRPSPSWQWPGTGLFNK